MRLMPKRKTILLKTHPGFRLKNWVVNSAKEGYKFLKTPERIAPRVVEILFLGVIAYILTVFVISPMLTPQTVIEVTINRNETGGLDLTFINHANFAGEEFKVYFRGLRVGSYAYGSFSPTNDLCKINELKASPSQNQTIGFEANCDYIPPNSKINFLILNPEASDIPTPDGKIHVTYWSKNTPETKKTCDSETLNCT